jgi:periplasmic protein CpxP/Spy
MISKNWRVALIGACIAVSSYAGIAQSDTPPAPPAGEGQHGNWGGRQDPERELKMLTHMLILTPDQQTGVKAILLQQSSQMLALRNQAQGTAATTETRQARMAQINQIREESSTKISALLDDNQKKLYADWQQRRKAAMEQRRSHGQDGAPPPEGGTPPPSEN